MSEEVEEIVLSSDSEPEILDTSTSARGHIGIGNRERNTVLSGFKAQLSQIRGFYPQKSAKTEGDTGNSNVRNGRSSPQSSSSSSNTSGNSRAVNINGNRLATGRTQSSIIPEEVVLDDDDDFEIEYGVDDDESADVAKRNGGSGDDDLQILESENSSQDNSSRVSAVKANGLGADKGALSPVESIELDDEEEEDEDEVEESVEQCEQRTQALVTAFGVEFAKCRKPYVQKAKIEKARKKVQKLYGKISLNTSMAGHIRLQEEIKSAIEALKITPKNYWSITANLMRKMDPVEMAKSAEVPASVRKEAQATEKQILLEKAERQLRKLQRQIRTYEEMDVDWDDEDDHNSSYILQEKTKKRMIDAYYRICDITKCSQLLGRPVQKSIRLKKHGASSSYDEIDSAVEKFVNKGGFLFIPDYVEILTIVNKVNQTKALDLTAEAASRLAQTIFEKVVLIIKKRRQKDFNMSMLCHLPAIRNREPVAVEEEVDEEKHKIEDPAEIDNELKEKLEVNETLKKSESEIFDNFVRRAQDEGKQSREVPEGENLNSSPPPSDTENADENDEGDSEGDGDYDDGDRDMEKSLVENHHVELTEDEDEEPETVCINISTQDGDDGVDDDDETSNEGGAGGIESESDTNTGEIDSVHGVFKEADADTKESTGVKKRKNSEDADESIQTIPTPDSDPPPSKKMKPDENSNESLNVDLAVAEKLSSNDNDIDKNV